MAIAHDVTTTAAAFTSTGTQTTSHVASASATGAVVLIAQNGTVADEVSGVTYGGVAMKRYSFNTEATEDGAVYIYWLDGVLTGTQNVAMTTTANTNKQLSVSTMTTTAGRGIVPVGAGGTGTSASVANPTWTTTGLTAGVATQAYEVIHSGLGTMTTTPATGWTLISSTDLGSQGRGFARLFTASSSTSLTAGWIAATADDFVGNSIVFVETLLADVSSTFTVTRTSDGVVTSFIFANALLAVTADLTTTQYLVWGFLEREYPTWNSVEARTTWDILEFTTLEQAPIINYNVDSTRATTVSLTANAIVTSTVQASTPITTTLTANSNRNTTGQSSTPITATETAAVIRNSSIQSTTVTTTALVAALTLITLGSSVVTANASLTANAAVTKLINTSSPIVFTPTAAINKGQAIGADSSITVTVTSDSLRNSNGVTSSPITFSPTSSVTRNTTGQSSTSISAGLTAIAILNKSLDSNAAVTVGLTSNSNRNTTGLVATNVTVGLTASASQNATVQANTTITVDLTTTQYLVWNYLEAFYSTWDIVETRTTWDILEFTTLEQTPVTNYNVNSTLASTASLTTNALKNTTGQSSNSISVGLTTAAAQSSTVQSSNFISANITTVANKAGFVNVAVPITATLTADGTVTRNAQATTVITTTFIAAVSPNIASNIAVTATLTAAGVVARLAQASTSETATLTASVSKNQSPVADTLITATLNAQVNRDYQVDVNTQVSASLTAELNKNFTIGANLAVSASISTTATRSNLLTDHDVDITVALDHQPWVLYLDEQPWIVVNQVFILEATLDPAVQTYASLDIDSNYYTLEYNLWEVTL
jgi:hypothetical protein